MTSVGVDDRSAVPRAQGEAASAVGDEADGVGGAVPESDERPVVLRALAIVVAAVFALAVVDAIAFREEEEARVELVRRCLETERSAPTVDVELGSPARAASQGALKALVEGNFVTIGLAASNEEGERLEQAFAAAPPPIGFIERRGRIVFRWSQPPSPTQLQAVYDCSY